MCAHVCIFKTALIMYHLKHTHTRIICCPARGHGNVTYPSLARANMCCVSAFLSLCACVCTVELPQSESKHLIKIADSTCLEIKSLLTKHRQQRMISTDPMAITRNLHGPQSMPCVCVCVYAALILFFMIHNVICAAHVQFY